MTGFPLEITAPILGLAWFAAVNLLVSLLAMAASGLFSDGPHASAWRARGLLAVRLAPAAASLAFAALLFLPAHVWLEPARADERIGLVPLALAACGSGLVLLTVGRAIAALRMTLQIATLIPRRGRRSGGIPVTEVPGLQGVALAGIFRPRILIGSAARRVLTRDELRLAVAHERAHQRAWDNLSRALIRCAPDVFRWSPQARRVERLWEAEAECLADAAAVAGSPVRATRLASALIKVARLASGERAWVPGWSTFHHPALLETRVRLLVSTTTVARPSANAVRAAAAGGMAVVATAWLAGLPQGLHRITEAILVLLP